MTHIKYYIDEAGDTLAVFPKDYYNIDLYGKSKVTCYMHVGQHSCADKGYVKSLKPATIDQYKDLHRELLYSVGYLNEGYQDLLVLNEDLEVYTTAYKECALWTNGLDNATIYQFTKESQQRINKVVCDFICNNYQLIKDSGLSPEQLGHSLYLSQHHHGAGFFDFHLDSLQDLAGKLHEYNVYRIGRNIFFE